MATLCRNCGHALVFDPASQKMLCEACGSFFEAEEVESEVKRLRQDLKAESVRDVYGDDADKDMMDCYIYSCSECGGEISVNGTEASTTCIYCGNPNVVFSRISRQKCPEFILPFTISKDEAIRLVHEKIDRGLFIPKAIKEFTPDCVRGIYIPYWIVDADYTNAMVISGQVRNGKSTVTRFYGRAGNMRIRRLPVEGASGLTDESSMKLEPFDLTKLRDFDEDYLSGFYSNVSDITYGDVRSVVNKRALDFFSEAAMQEIKASNKKVANSRPSLCINRDMKYAMLPAWFITFKHKGKSNTILVNGESGKVVCALPWNKVLFFTLLVIIGILATVVSFFALRGLLPVILSSRSKNNGRLLGAIVMGIIVLFATGISKVRRVIKNIVLTQDKAIFDFTKKRQG
ncbi:MAG: hypothetical protein II718_08285 [Clostridiales bacterium]|nr:hypothetical protein [Clostridiales bacterium]